MQTERRAGPMPAGRSDLWTVHTYRRRVFCFVMVELTTAQTFDLPEEPLTNQHHVADDLCIKICSPGLSSHQVLDCYTSLSDRHQRSLDHPHRSCEASCSCGIEDLG